MYNAPESKALVRVKEKFQVTLPNELRLKAGLVVGDFLEVGIERGGVITLTPKSLVDRHIAEGLADLKAGRVHGPFRSADEAVAALDKRAAATKKSKR
jgi:bifunctional DNA-binding transcriptional regulator/antitoxin component of YhaV-PrlF toxin-antitoxin module